MRRYGFEVEWDEAVSYTHLLFYLYGGEIIWVFYVI